MTVKFNKSLRLLRVTLKIGVWNVVRVLRYRIALRFKTLRFNAQDEASESSAFFAPSLASVKTRPVTQKAFGWKEVTFDAPPDWHSSIISPHQRVNRNQHWYRALASVPKDIDVKEIWEYSRFYWVPQLAKAASEGDAAAGATLNLWLRDWEAQNPPYKGINWSCGQEAAIRILHLAQAAIILKEIDVPQATLVRLLANSAARIAPTLHYALGQSNNHGSTEAAGLFVAGAWLERLGVDNRAVKWKKRGRRWLENRAKTLILKDGSSNQYSTNYHRVVLDTFCFAEIWRRQIGEPSFSGTFLSRVQMASRWLYEMTDCVSGAAPVFGANDGSLLFAEAPRNYRDFRPSIQLSTVLFEDKSAYSSDQFDEILNIYNLDRPVRMLSEQSSQFFESGGYMSLRRKNAVAIMRYPNYAFRPSHADALHVDLHVNGNPILFDAGTYSYITTDGIDLSHVSAHNTIEFDGRDQMDRVSRFLYSDWLRTHVIEKPTMHEGYDTCVAGYKDKHGCNHRRSLYLDDNILVVRDQVSGFKNEAILRWRLPFLEYVLDEGKLKIGNIIIEVKPRESISFEKVVESYYSPYYMMKDRCIVYEIGIIKTGLITTKIEFSVGSGRDKSIDELMP